MGNITKTQNSNNKNLLYNQKIQLGILMMIMASFFFSLMAPLIKRFNHLPLMELVFFRNLPTIFILP